MGRGGGDRGRGRSVAGSDADYVKAATAGLSAPRAERPSTASKGSGNHREDLLQEISNMEEGPGRSVIITDLREKFPRLSKEEFDKHLIDLQREEKLVLYHDDKGADMAGKAHSEKGALHLPSGLKRHLIYLEPTGRRPKKR